MEESGTPNKRSLALVSWHHSPAWMLLRSSPRVLQQVERICALGLSRKADVIQTFTGLFEVRKGQTSGPINMLPDPHFPEQPLSQDNHKHLRCQIMARSWPDATNVFKEKESFRHKPVSQKGTPEVLGSAPVLGCRGGLWVRRVWWHCCRTDARCPLWWRGSSW